MISNNSPTNSVAPMRIDKLSKSFGGYTAVNFVSMTLQSGELLSLLGPNGAGKTTLMRMLTGILLPDTGSIFLNEKKNPNRNDVSLNIGYCPQRIIVWRDLTCLEQLKLVANMYRFSSRQAAIRTTELLQMFNLSLKRNALAKTLSGGMQRRLSIALAMVHRPSILVLDEPEAGLDPQSRVQVRDTLHRLRSETRTTIIVSTHDMAEAELISGRIAIMNHGKLLAVDTPQKLIAEGGSSHLVELKLENATQSQQSRLVAAIEQLGTPVQSQDKTISVACDESGAMVRPIRTIVARENLKIIELRHRKRSLEDVFLALTSHKTQPSVKKA